MKERDYVSQWFEIYRHHHEPADILFLIEHNSKSELVRFPHEQADGAGALFTFAEQYHWRLDSPQMVSRKISPLKYFLNCILFLFWTRPRKKNIWPFSFAKSLSDNTLYASHCFTAAQTSALKEKCRELGVSLNAYLFYSLNKTLEKKFRFQTIRRSWWIPVNMRADLGLDPRSPLLKKNYVSNFTIDVSGSMSINDYQKLMAKMLKQQRHWATWWWQQLGRFVSENVVEKVALKNLKNNFYVGTFSNLGEWNCSEAGSNVAFLANPVLSHPIGASAIVWNGRLNIGLRIYNGFPLTEPELEALLQAWAT